MESNDVSLTHYPNLSDQVYEIVKTEILSGSAAPGTQLEVVAIAKRLGVSRTPVKDAISRLIMEGLIQDVARKGYFVSKRDSEEIAALVDARLILELAAVERGLAEAEPADIEALERLLDAIDHTLDEQGCYLDYEEFVRKDADFHFRIVGIARNRHLLDAYQRIFLHYHAARMHLALGPGYRRGFETKKEHAAILAAFRSKDLAALKLALTEHMRNTSTWFAGAQARLDQAGSTPAGTGTH